MAPKTKASKQKGDTPKAKSLNGPPTNAAMEARPPNWPALTPISPTIDLTFNTLWEDQILTISRFWTTALCKNYVAFLRTLPLSTTPGKPKRGDAVRVNDRFQVQDAAFAERLWSETALREMVSRPTVDDVELELERAKSLWGGEVVGLNPNIRVYRYSKGQFFDQHCRSIPFLSLYMTYAEQKSDDESNNVSFQSSGSTTAEPAKTTWTLLLYLSSPTTGCEGGQTVFYPDPPSKREAAPPPVVAELEVGQLLLHRHGKACLLHEGREVTAGEKWIIRTDLCVKR